MAKEPVDDNSTHRWKTSKDGQETALINVDLRETDRNEISVKRKLRI